MDVKRFKCCISITNIPNFIIIIIVSIITTSTAASRITPNLKHVVPGQVDVYFPTPAVENVYKEWKPVDFGHPLRDATLYYAPPSLKRVHLDGRSSAESRSLADDFGDDKTTEDLFPVVIAAEPRRDLKENDYSVYGSPSVDYFKLYSQPAAKFPTHNVPLDDGREDPHLALQRDYLNPVTSLAAGESLDVPSGAGDAPRRRSDFGGGIRYVDPPNRQPEAKSYYYYSEDSPYYKERLASSPGRRDHPAVGLKYAPSLTVSAVPPTPTPALTTKSPPRAEGRSADAVGTSPNAVVYSYDNEFGQRAKVGVILDAEDLTADASTLSHGGTGRPLSGLRGSTSETPEPLRTIPLTAGHAGDASAFTGQQAKAYPLGAPFKVPERPKFFPVQNRPPIYKTRPNRLEGVFGPALPERPGPDAVAFPDDHEYAEPKVRGSDPRSEDSSRPRVATDEDDGNFVYKVDREMEFRRPAVILRVGHSNELYRPDDPSDHIWKPEARENSQSTQTEKPFSYVFREDSATLSQPPSALDRESLPPSKTSSSRSEVKDGRDEEDDLVVEGAVGSQNVSSRPATSSGDSFSYLGIPLELPVEMKKTQDSVESLQEVQQGLAEDEQDPPPAVRAKASQTEPTSPKIKSDVRLTNHSTHEYLTRLLHFLGGPRPGQPGQPPTQKRSRRAHL